MKGAETDIRIRLARPRDAMRLPDIERSAGTLFRAAPDLAWVADHTPTSAGFYAPLIRGGTVWVAAAGGVAPVGFVSAEVVDEDLHVWELAVRADAQRRGLGRRLMRAAMDHARAQGLAAVTLTTFRDVAWNAPFYQSLGFRVLTESELSAVQVDSLRGEAARGLPMERRCGMRWTTP
jgi:ribosomal protein S18 acetylase RimI-like enzyme